MTDVPPRPPSRRGVLAGAATLLVAGCTRTSAPEPPPGPTPDERLAARVAAEISTLVAAYAATIARHPGTRPRLSTLMTEHEAHLSALHATTPTPTPSATASASSSPTPSGTAAPVPATPADARAALATAEAAAASRRGDQALRARPELARLLASIAACGAGHVVLLRGPE
ncbi:MAG: hypothetical protein QOH75_2834 [Actinomycetota bacterium]|nr:hypothetical protein [Actinomycetota bacterium]